MNGQKLIQFIFSAALFFFIASCGKVVTNASLDVSVLDSNFAKPLAGVDVILHSSQDGAKNGSDTLKYAITNSSGVASFDYVPGNQTHWVSANSAFIDRRIKQSPEIGSGDNKMTIFVSAWSNMEVYVSGTLSGKPRDNIHVEFYSSEDDAKSRVNLITSNRTNGEGRASFTRLNLGTVYWVRANAIASFSIKQTHALNLGQNHLDMKLL